MLENSIVSRKDDKGLPSISVIVLNYNGREHLGPCFASLSRLDYRQEKLELILVDNGSSDGSIAYMKANFPEVRIVQNDHNLGFARGNNIGAAEASGQYVAFLNNDMRVDPHWLIELLKPMVKERDVVCTASKILSWDGKRIDFVGGALNFYGHGFQLDYGRSNIEDYAEERPLLFACGGAMLIARKVFLESGGFDEDYFAFFEDIDLGWRLWMLGYRIIFAPKAIVYHQHHGTSKKIALHELRVLYERNALYTIIKNYEQQYLDRILPAALLLTVKRALVYGGLERHSYQIDAGGTSQSRENISKLALSHLVALDEVIHNIPRLMEKRMKLQKLRKRSDSEIFTLFEKPFQPNCPGIAYAESQNKLSRHLHVADIFAEVNIPHILIISHDHIGKQMAGPAIRYWEIANALGKKYEVTLAAPGNSDLASPDVKIESYGSSDDIADLATDADVILISGYLLHDFQCLLAVSKPLVVDVYDPFTLKNLEIHTQPTLHERVRVHERDLGVLKAQLEAGDFFICHSERQLDFWLGMLYALNRVNSYTYGDDKLCRLIDVVPFGIPSEPPQHTKRVLRGVYKTIQEEDKVILWGGGIWDWFDPCTLIKAMANIAAHRHDVKLFFMGIKHPNPLVPRMQATSQAIQLSQDLGLYDKFVFFNEWVPYEERQNYLLEADVGVSLHLDHIETRFSFRTRRLDYIWASLPIVTTRGDSMSKLVKQHNLGKVVDYGDVGQVTDTLMELLGTPNLREVYRPGFEEVKSQFTWERAVEPLARFCANPRFAPDRAALGSRSWFASPGQIAVKPTPWWALPGKAWYIFRRGGWDALRREAKSYLRWRFSA